MSSIRQQPSSQPESLHPAPPTLPPHDTFIPLKDRYPIPSPLEIGSLQHLIASHPRLQLFVQPRRWTNTHLSLLSISIVDEDAEESTPAGPREFEDLEPSEDEYAEIVRCIGDLPKGWDLQGAQDGMDRVMGALLRAVLGAEEERCGEVVRGEFMLKHTLHTFFAGKIYLPHPKEATHNSHHGYRIPLFALPLSPQEEEANTLAGTTEGKHRLVWAYLGPADIYRARRSMLTRGVEEWEVTPWAVGVLIQLAMEAFWKEEGEWRDEIEVTVFVADYSDEDTNDDDYSPALKLTRFTANIHTSFLLKFEENRKCHEGELVVFRKSWPVEEGFAGDLFEAVAEGSLSEAAVGEWERGVIRVVQEEEGEDEDMEGRGEEGEDRSVKGVKRKAEGMAGGVEGYGREEVMGEDDSPVFL